MRWIVLLVFALAVPTTNAAPVPKHLMPKPEDPATRRANLLKLARVYDAMTPECAAPILKSMVESGSVDDTAEILLLMKERNLARVLEAMDDPPTVMRLVDRMHKINKQKAAPPAAPVPQPVKRLSGR